MRCWKFYALVALAVVPLLFLSNKKKEEARPVVGDVDNIFEEELTLE